MVNEDFSATDAKFEVDQFFAREVYNSVGFSPNYIARYIYEINGAKHDFNTMEDIYLHVLQYIFDMYIADDIADAVVYNECVDYINEHNIAISEDELRVFINARFDWSYSFREAFDSFTRQLKAEYGKSSIGKSLAKQLNLKVGDTFTIGALSNKYTITNDGITCNSRWISQQQLLHILYDGLSVRKVDE